MLFSGEAPVGASLLAIAVDQSHGCIAVIASKLAPTGVGAYSWIFHVPCVFFRRQKPQNPWFLGNQGFCVYRMWR